MEVTISFENMNLVRVKSGYTKERSEFDNFRRLTKAIPGAYFSNDLDKSDKFWRFHIDHLAMYVPWLQQAGYSVVMPPEHQRFYTDYLLRQQQIADWSFRNEDPEWVNPTGLLSVPRGYQQVAVRIMGLANPGFLEADPVGTGKSIMCIADMLTNGILRWCPNCPGEEHPGHIETAPDQVLFLTLGSLRWNVFKEFVKHTSIRDLVTVVDGDKKKRVQQWAERTPIKVSSYEGALKFDWELIPHRWRRIYADEFMKVKNFRTSLHQRFNMLTVDRGIVGMTATPIEMNLREMYTLFRILQPGLLGHFNQFREEFLTIDENTGLVVGSRNHTRFAERVAMHQIKRKKSEILSQLPEKTAMTINVMLNDFERKEYEEISEHFLTWMDKSPDRLEANSNVVNDELKKNEDPMLRMRQFLDFPQLVDPAYPETCSKLEVLEELVRDIEGKMVVFTQWSKVAVRLDERMRALGYETMLVTGDSVNNRRRIEMAEEFNTPENTTKLFITTDALSHGVDLVGASTIIHYDALWNPGKMIEQREGRLHRIGQVNKVLAIRLVTDDTIEEAIERVLYSRGNVAEEVYTETESALRRWNTSDWKKALKGKKDEA